MRSLRGFLSIGPVVTVWCKHALYVLNDPNWERRGIAVSTANGVVRYATLLLSIPVLHPFSKKKGEKKAF